MTIIDIISKKRDSKELSKEEINFWITEMMNDNIADYQVSALLMAIVLNGMTYEETFYLTDAMVNSGNIINLSDIDGIKIDKHSTGGVGDKITIILAPLLASFGLKMAKMSGRGLGYTGGTADKLESIPGYKLELNSDEFIKQVKDIGISIISQSDNIALADKKLYALRDTTGTVSSISLIAASIMSKKIASGADLIFIDLKVGDGALIKTLEEAKELANTMVRIGESFNKKVIIMLTNMDEPLGYAIGNSLEIMESIDTLKGMGPSDVMEIIIKIAGIVVSYANDISVEEAEAWCFKKINNGDAHAKFEEWINAQGGNLEALELSDRIVSIRSVSSGYITKIKTEALGELARQIGAGRMRKEDNISYKAGIVLSKKLGEYVEENEELAKVYLDERDARLGDFLECFVLEAEQTNKKPLIYEIIG